MDSSDTKLLLIVAGINVFYGAYGVVKEEIMAGRYDGEKFGFTYFLLLTECVFNMVFAVVLALLTKSSLRSNTTFTQFFALGLSYIGAMYCSTYALREVNYPTQVLAKSCKAVPIMFFNFLLGREKYPLKRWLAVGLVVLGVFIFTMAGSNKAAKTNKVVGLVLVFVSLCLDGLTGTTQTQLRKTTKPSQYEFMLYMNMVACFGLAIMFLVSGEATQLPAFLASHPEVLARILLYALCGAFGQIFIFWALTAYGPERLALITTTRKFFSLLLSFVYFAHPLSIGVVAGSATVFGGLYLEKQTDVKHDRHVVEVKATPPKNTKSKKKD